MNAEVTTPSVVETIAAPVATLADLQAEVIRLRAQVDAKGKTIKAPVTNEEFAAALSKLEGINAESLASDNPSARPNLSLTSIMGVTPDKTKEQNALWKPFKSKWEKAFSAKHRELVPQAKAMIARAMRNAGSLVSTVRKVRKDGTTQKAALSVSEPRKAPKGKGLKKAKPAQVAAHVPAAGNAQTPAMVS
jgi:hypothetical protein